MKVLFVCTGNTCRSAMAEKLLSKLAKDEGLNDIIAESCGTSASPLYHVPDVVVTSMSAEKIDISAHKSTQVSEILVNRADLILAMENHHKNFVVTQFSAVSKKVFLLKEYIGEKGNLEIPDPFGHDEVFYKKTVEELKGYVKKLINKIKNVR